MFGTGLRNMCKSFLTRKIYINKKKDKNNSYTKIYLKLHIKKVQKLRQRY